MCRSSLVRGNCCKQVVFVDALLGGLSRLTFGIARGRLAAWSWTVCFRSCPDVSNSHDEKPRRASCTCFPRFMHVLPEIYARASRNSCTCFPSLMHLRFVVFSIRLLTSKQQRRLLNFVSGALRQCLFDTWVKREERADLDSIQQLTDWQRFILPLFFELFSVLVLLLLL